MFSFMLGCLCLLNISLESTLWRAPFKEEEKGRSLVSKYKNTWAQYCTLVVPL